MKKKWKITVGLLIFCFAFLGGCGKADEKKILGTWYEVDYNGEADYDEELTFYEDGMLYGFDREGEYSFMNEKLYIRFELLISDYNYIFDYEIEGDTLTLTDENGKEWKYVRE